MDKEDALDKLTDMVEALESQTRKFIDFAQSILRSDIDLSDEEVLMLTTILAARADLTTKESKK